VTKVLISPSVRQPRILMKGGEFIMEEPKNEQLEPDKNAGEQPAGEQIQDETQTETTPVEPSTETQPENGEEEEKPQA
jgi:hypothetical protein